MKYKLSKYKFSILHGGYIWWFNTTNGSIIRLEPNKEFKLLNALLVNESLDYLDIKILTESGFLVPDSYDETTEIQNLIDFAKTSVDVLSVTIAPTLGCNFSCTYCFESKTEDFQSRRGWTDEIRSNVLSYVVSNLCGRSGLFLRWFGGEPLLAIHDVYSVGKKLRFICQQSEMTFRSQVQTNGYKLTSENCNLLLEAGVTDIHVTLDGAKDRHNLMRQDVENKDTFNVILMNLKSAIKIFENVQIRINTIPAVIPYFDALFDSLIEIDPDRKLNLYTAPVYKRFNGLELPGNPAIGFSTVADYADAELVFLQKASERGYSFDWSFLNPRTLACSALKADGIMIGSRGEIVKCDHDYGVPDATIGDVSKGIDNIDRYAEWLAVHPKNNPLCSQCVLLPTCGGHCESIRRTVQIPEEACPSKKYNYEKRSILGILDSNWIGLPKTEILLVKPPKRPWPVPVSVCH